MEELKPCPFCGDNIITIKRSRAGYTIGCNTVNCIMCHATARIRAFDKREDAIEAWNRRK